MKYAEIKSPRTLKLCESRNRSFNFFAVAAIKWKPPAYTAGQGSPRLEEFGGCSILDSALGEPRKFREAPPAARAKPAVPKPPVPLGQIETGC